MAEFPNATDSVRYAYNNQGASREFNLNDAVISGCDGQSYPWMSNHLPIGHNARFLREPIESVSGKRQLGLPSFLERPNDFGGLGH